jgi:predicted MPP superfamily phosphohydrolase
MSRVVTVVIFLSIAISLLFGIHYYIWARLIRDTMLSAPWRPVATTALVVLGVSMPLTLIVGRAFGRGSVGVFAWPAFVWMGLMVFLFFLLVGSDAVRLVLFAGRKLSGAAVLSPERRVFLGRLVGGAIAAAAAGLGVFAMREALGRVRVRALDVTLGRLPQALDGTTLVQLTDVHVGPTIGRSFIEQIVAQVNALSPDVVAITGDLVDGSVEQLREKVAPLAKLQARHGVFFVTGNHEYYSGVDAWVEELGRLGIKVLRNERVRVGNDLHSFDLAGIDDYSSRGLALGHGPDLSRAVEGRDTSRELVLLAHQPRAIRDAKAHGVGLQLSGHTHGGQIWPWNFLVRLQQPYVAGYAREGNTQLYVSRGTGYWGPPMRLGAPAEITRITLRAGAKSA